MEYATLEKGGDIGGQQHTIYDYMTSLVFKNTGARITVASIDQSIRGVRHYQHRPDLIILDDIEDLNSTRTLENRNKTFEWFTREIVPLGDMDTRIVMVGNLLHEDCLMMRLRKKIEAKEIRGTFQWFPLVAEEGHCLWPGKFDMPEKIEDLRRSVANELAWQQEYLLNIISDSTRVIWPEWIQYYETLPEGTTVREVLVGIDLAISEREHADCTAAVILKVYGRGKDLKVYVLPNPINKRMGFMQTIETIKAIDNAIRASGERLKIIIETNGFQEIYLETLKRDGVRSVEGIKQIGDKHSRLALASYYIQNGTVVFPKIDAEELIAQMTGFGIEHYDDLCDAFSTAVIKLIEVTKYDDSECKVIWI